MATEYDILLLVVYGGAEKALWVFIGVTCKFSYHHLGKNVSSLIHDHDMQSSADWLIIIVIVYKSSVPILRVVKWSEDI